MFIQLSLPLLETLSASGGYRGMVVLGNFSTAMLLSVCVWLHDYDNWRGAGYELTDAEKDDIDEYVSNAEYALMSSALGIIMPYAGASIPDWALLCDGAGYLRVDYPELYATLDSAFIVDADNFEVPDLSDRFVYGVGVNDVGDSGGAESHTLTEAQLASHSHGNIPHSHTYTAPVLGVVPTGGGAPIPSVNAVAPLITVASGITINNAGSGDDIDHMPPFLTLSYIVVAG